MKEITNTSQFIFYNGRDGKIHVQVILGEETVWANQTSIAEIFGIDRSGITKHIQNIYDTGELSKHTTSAKIAQVQNEGGKEVTRNVEFYNLDMIIAVGYRVSSYNATQFRIWATNTLKEYLIKGFALDDERLRQGNRLFNKDYFRELLERIREIRASERMFYEKITDLYATAVDYDKNSPETHKFFAKVQNKLEFAIVGQTSAEIISARVNSAKPHMGLTTWKNSGREGKVQKSDVTIAKNYLEEDEIRKLNTLVNMYLDYAELQVERNRLMKMTDWSDDVLDNAGKIRKDVADAFAENEYLKFRVIQDKEYKSDFNKIINELKTNNKLPSEPDIDANDEKKNSFDQTLKGLLSVPPPKKNNDKI
jgi:hypothetical protein